MKTFVPIPVMLLAICLLTGCRKNSEFTEIGFGIRQATDYTINADGGLYITENGTTTYMKNVGKEETRAIQDMLDEIPSAAWSLQQPDSITYFIRVNTENGIRRADWGDPNYTVPTEVQELYDYMMGLVN